MSRRPPPRLEHGPHAVPVRDGPAGGWRGGEVQGAPGGHVLRQGLPVGRRPAGHLRLFGRCAAERGGEGKGAPMRGEGEGEERGRGGGVGGAGDAIPPAPDASRSLPPRCGVRVAARRARRAPAPAARPLCRGDGRRLERSAPLAGRLALGAVSEPPRDTLLSRCASDPTQLASCSDDGTVRVWRVARGAARNAPSLGANPRAPGRGDTEAAGGGEGDPPPAASAMPTPHEPPSALGAAAAGSSAGAGTAPSVESGPAAEAGPSAASAPPRTPMAQRSAPRAPASSSQSSLRDYFCPRGSA